MKNDDAHEALKKRAAEQSPLSQDSVGGKFVYPYFFEIKDKAGKDVVARLNLTQGAFYMDLVKTKKEEGSNVISYEMKNRQVLSYGNHTFNTSTPAFSATKTVVNMTDASGNVIGNSTKLDISFAYTEANTSSGPFVVDTAELKMTLEWGNPGKVALGYWNITSISATVAAKLNGSATNFNVDLTPRFSSTGRPADSSCETGYGICAPVNLCWSCGDQVLKPGNLTAVGPGQFTVMWHLRGMLLEPDWGRGLNTTTFRFSSNWDCDPLLPLSVWVGILITLLLASILLWAVSMLSALQTPNKWDDPKKPGIQVAQAE